MQSSLLASVSLVAVLASAGLASAQQTSIPLPAFSSTYNFTHTRGFWFTAPVDCTLVRLQVPNEASQPNQVVEVIDFGTTPPPTTPALAGTQLFYDNQTPAGGWCIANVPLRAGRIYGILGACTDGPTSANSFNSYGNGPYDTSVFGFPISLQRLGAQTGIASNGGNQPVFTGSGPIARVTVQITQDRIMVPSFSTTYTSSQTRGFYFTAPVTCRMVSLQVPNEANQPYQVVEVIDFGTTPPPAFPATAVGTQLYYNNGVAAGATIGVNILLQAGRTYGVLGACTPTPTSATSHNSYGPTGTYTANAFGIYPIPIRRLLTQSGIASNGGNQPCSAEVAGNVGRIFVGLDGAGTTNYSNINDYYVTSNGWPSTSAQAPSALVGIRTGNPSFGVYAPSTAAGGVVVGLANFGMLTQPGALCLPPVGGTYASLPNVAACGATNMSWDLAPNPTGSWILFYGTLNASGDFAVQIPIPGFVGVFGSTQAFFLDTTTGFVATEAFNWVITP